MSWLFFLDESGHDHRTMPYEVRGGIAIRASALWSFITSVQAMEQAHFGCLLRHVGSEIKGSKLLQPERFRWAAQDGPIDSQSRRKRALNFLNSAPAGKIPRRAEFTAFGQACLSFCGSLLDAMAGYNIKLFAAMVPPVSNPHPESRPALRKDIDRLLAEFARFIVEQGDIDSRQETGLLVIDRSERTIDRQFALALEDHSTNTGRGWVNAQYVPPAPFFVDSDMVLGVQVADICIYVLNWAFRLPSMTHPIREELLPLAEKLKACMWTRFADVDGETRRYSSVFFEENPYPSRDGWLFNRDQK